MIRNMTKGDVMRVPDGRRGKIVEFKAYTVKKGLSMKIVPTVTLNLRDGHEDFRYEHLTFVDTGVKVCKRP